MPTLCIGLTLIPYTVSRSSLAKRKRIIVTASTVEVIVPQEANEQDLTDFIHKKRRWIYDKRQNILERLGTALTRTLSRLQSGAVIAYKGRNVRLRISRTGCKEIKIEYRNGFYVSVPKRMTDHQIAECLDVEMIFWLRDRLKTDAIHFAKVYSQKLGLKYRALSIVKTPSLWGSCTKSGTIKLNWHLVAAPKSVLAYVVLHEICHLKHRNHSKEFWALLASQMPDYEVKRKWLETQNPTCLL